MSLGGVYSANQSVPDSTSSLLKVRLDGAKTGFKVFFRVTPDLIENRNVNYKTMDPVHLPGNILTYQNTAPRTFSINSIKIISRTSTEAEENLNLLNILRGWTMPVFGQEPTGTTVEPLGSPPELLYFSAYSSSERRGNLYRIPAVMTQLSIPYPSDVDYVNTKTDNIPFPAVMTIDMMLTETHSPTDYSNFSLQDYRQGNLEGF